MSTKQRMISPADLATLADVPDVAKPLAMWLWLNLDPLGRGLMDPRGIGAHAYPTRARAEATDATVEHLLMLMEAGWLTTYRADGAEWILLLYPLKVDMRGVRIATPDPPDGSPWTSMAVGGGVGGRERAGARERARAEVRAEAAARADAWDAVQRDREAPPERPERPMLLDAPPMFCDEHMPLGTREKCGPCRDRRLYRDKWLAEQVYETRLTRFYEQGGVDDEPF